MRCGVDGEAGRSLHLRVREWVREILLSVSAGIVAEAELIAKKASYVVHVS